MGGAAEASAAEGGSRADSAGASDAATPATKPAAATPAAATPAATTPAATPWIKRHRPARNLLELGVFAGVMVPAKDHELYNPAVDGVSWQPYRRAAPDFGLRFGYYPLAVLGLEIEGAVAPTKTAVDGARAVLGSFRGYALAQLPYRVTPFALFGVGILGTTGLGKDNDPVLHFGGGVKFYMNDLLALRLDVRDSVGTRHGQAQGRTHYLEVLLGLSVVLGRKKPVDPDGDGDGFKDRVDACPKVPGVAPDGCPAPVDPDSDGDGFTDKHDTCPTEPGVAPDGCPVRDRDKDQILDPDDGCPDVPETRNNYQDEDGCPDEVPKEVKKFTGVIEGIFFDVDKDTIKPASRATLDRAAQVMREFPDMKVEISGHTDAEGDRAYNVELSRRRAEAVRKYLVDAGIDPGRITTRGAGPDEPIADNTSEDGRAKNRRIEFTLVQ